MWLWISYKLQVSNKRRHDEETRLLSSSKTSFIYPYLLVFERYLINICHQYLLTSLNAHKHLQALCTIGGYANVCSNLFFISSRYRKSLFKESDSTNLILLTHTIDKLGANLNLSKMR